MRWCPGYNVTVPTIVEGTIEQGNVPLVLGVNRSEISTSGIALAWVSRDSGESGCRLGLAPTPSPEMLGCSPSRHIILKLVRV